MKQLILYCQVKTTNVSCSTYCPLLCLSIHCLYCTLFMEGCRWALWSYTLSVCTLIWRRGREKETMQGEHYSVFSSFFSFPPHLFSRPCSNTGVCQTWDWGTIEWATGTWRHHGEDCRRFIFMWCNFVMYFLELLACFTHFSSICCHYARVFS